MGGLIWASSASTSRDGLPNLDTISFWVGEPAEPSKLVAFAFGIDRDAFVYQTVQHSVEVMHLEVDHRFLCRRKVLIIVSEEGQDDLSALRRGRKRERPFGADSGGCRSAFRTDVDHDSEVMPISVPN